MKSWKLPKRGLPNWGSFVSMAGLAARPVRLRKSCAALRPSFRSLDWHCDVRRCLCISSIAWQSGSVILTLLFCVMFFLHSWPSFLFLKITSLRPDHMVRWLHGNISGRVYARNGLGSSYKVGEFWLKTITVMIIITGFSSSEKLNNPLIISNLVTFINCKTKR